MDDFITLRQMRVPSIIQIAWSELIHSYIKSPVALISCRTFFFFFFRNVKILFTKSAIPCLDQWVPSVTSDASSAPPTWESSLRGDFRGFLPSLDDYWVMHVSFRVITCEVSQSC